MLQVRRMARCATTRLYKRSYSTPYVPQKAREEALPAPSRGPPLPESPTFLSGRSTYLDTVYLLEKQLNNINSLMHRAHITPLPKAANHAVAPIRNYWQDAEEMYQMLGVHLKNSQHRRIISLLTQLNRLRSIASLCENTELEAKIISIISPFEKANKDVLAAVGKRKPIVPDEFGRCYALGRRKTSSARVWVIPIQPEAHKAAENAGTIAISTCLVNGVPAAEYFSNTADREKVFRPLKLSGLLTAYNIYAIARGGGTTGQAEAIAHGMSKCLYAMEPEIGSVLAKCAFIHLLLDNFS